MARLRPPHARRVHNANDPPKRAAALARLVGKLAPLSLPTLKLLEDRVGSRRPPRPILGAGLLAHRVTDSVIVCLAHLVIGAVGKGTFLRFHLRLPLSVGGYDADQRSRSVAACQP